MAAAAAVLGLCASAPSGAQAADKTTVKLIELLVKNGVLTRTQATALMREAQAEAGGETATGRRRRAAPTQVVTTTPPVEAGETGAAAPAVHVTYVPPLVRDEIAAEVKQQVMQQAEEEGWADQYGAAAWTRRIHVSGDIRLRGEEDLLDRTNYPDFADFNLINNLPNGFDTNVNTNRVLPPTLNTTEDRSRFRLRARLNVEGQVADWIDADIRIATGNDGSPVSTNQTFGQFDNFSKYQIWLDLGYLQARPTPWLSVLGGRSYNPFWTSNLLFYDDLSFDGIAAKLAYPVTSKVLGFLNAGGFPVFNTAFNFGSGGAGDVKYASHDSWLLAIQGGAEWKITPNYIAKFGAGFFDFAGVEGAKSSACFEPLAVGACDTDETRILNFKQFGNTVMPLRSIVNDPTLQAGQTPEPQVYGLSSKFEVLDLHEQLKIVTFHPIDVTLSGDFVKNLGFNRSEFNSPSRYANNFAAGSTTGSPAFAGGGTAYDISLSVGKPFTDRLWDWNASIAYKYIETDALLDALTDPNFHLGGTNAKGYIVNGNLGLARNTYVSLTWYDADVVSGAPYSNQVGFIDLNAKF